MTVLDQSTHLDAPLSAAMREGSMAEHQDAENSSFMSELLGGRVNERGYADYLLRLRVVYAAMESVGRSPPDDPRSPRSTTRPWSASPRSTPTSTTGARAASARSTPPPPRRTPGRIEAAAEWGGLLVAHHYTRYLGDLSGGQAIGRILDREFELGGRGISFYAFPEIPKPKPYKDAYRARLDALGTDAEEKARVVDRGQGRLPAQPGALRRARRAAPGIPPRARDRLRQRRRALSPTTRARGRRSGRRRRAAPRGCRPRRPRRRP